MTPTKTKILIADDHPIVLRGLRTVLDAQPDLEVVAQATDGQEAVELALSEEIELVVLDISMPRKTGLQAAREITRRRPDVRVLMLSMHDNEQFLFEAIRAGAAGYVLKSSVDRDLVEACRATMRGEPFLYPGGVQALMREYLERSRSGETTRGRAAHPARGRGRQAHRRGPHQRRDRRAALHLQEDRGAPPREHPREARHAGSRRAHALRDPPRAHRAVSRTSRTSSRAPRPLGNSTVATSPLRAPSSALPTGEAGVTCVGGESGPRRPTSV